VLEKNGGFIRRFFSPAALAAMPGKTAVAALATLSISLFACQGEPYFSLSGLSHRGTTALYEPAPIPWRRI